MQVVELEDGVVVKTWQSAGEVFARVVRNGKPGAAVRVDRAIDVEKPPQVDFTQVLPSHAGIDRRLQNWAAWLRRRSAAATGSPMFRSARSNNRQWDVPVLNDPIDTLDAQKIEQEVSTLPLYHREAIRWHYVVRSSPARACKDFRVSMDSLAKLVQDGRQMLLGRCK